MLSYLPFARAVCKHVVSVCVHIPFANFIDQRMMLKTACKNSQKGKYLGEASIKYNVSFIKNNFLMFWEEENSVSVIFGKDVRCAEKSVGNECHVAINVAINGTDYNGKIAANGNH